MTWKHGPLVRILLCVLLANAAHARLGDTEDELIKRFGRPTSISSHSVHAQGKNFVLGPKLAFKQDDWNIRCDLIDGRCVRISYSKVGDWSSEHIRMVLNANAQGALWKEKPPFTKSQKHWYRSDGSTASWSTMWGMNLVWDTYNKAKAAVEERAKVDAKKKPKL